MGKFEWEVLELMPPDELSRWIAYFKIKAAEIKKVSSRPTSKKIMPKKTRRP